MVWVLNAAVAARSVSEKVLAAGAADCKAKEEAGASAANSKQAFTRWATKVLAREWRIKLVSLVG